MLSKILHAGLSLGQTPTLPSQHALARQNNQLLWLLQKARRTAFGQYYQFDRILKSNNIPEAYRKAIPILEYDDFYRQWWRFAREDRPDVTWPGVVPYYALSSGTSGASSKYIPVTKDMLRAMKRGSRKMFFDLSKYQLPAGHYHRKMLMVGSCTAPQQENGHFTGDLSGIIGMNHPAWLHRYYRPGKHITDLPEWSDRIESIAREAHLWDIGYVVGNPAWVQMIFETIIDRYGLQHMHDIWPNLALYVHGGVFFEPYRPRFEQLLGAPLAYIDSYMASEGFFAYQNRPDTRSLRLLTDEGVYYEFLPLNSQNFDEDGRLLPGAQACRLDEVNCAEQYALVISTCSGAWRYLLGDTIRFTDLSRTEFRLTGRTRQFLSVCGEHLSIDNLNEAVRRADAQLQAGIIEFAVAGVPHGNGWAHQWYLSASNPAVHSEQFALELDRQLAALNDDYAIERRYALKEVRVQILPAAVFYNWLRDKGKMNGQAKIPRVLKGDTLLHWQQFLQQQNHAPQPIPHA